MLFPYFQDNQRSRDMVTTFGGYNSSDSCSESEFLDMKNMSSECFPTLSPRNKRSEVESYEDPKAIMAKEGLLVIDGVKLYYKGDEVEGITLSETDEKTMVGMGAYVLILPDKVWYNTDNGDHGSVENSFELPADTDITFTLADSTGTAITYHDAAYYEEHDPQNGDYQLSVDENGKASLRQYSSTTRIWSTVTTTYLSIVATDIGKGLKVGDGVELTIQDVTSSWSDIGNIFVNDNGDGSLSTNSTLYDVSDDKIVIVGITQAAHIFRNIVFSVERKMPDMAFVTECNNRIWGCSKDGHEIYCCKLGDLTNWNVFSGLSTDAYAVTIGSDGEFTGAVTYQGYPFFFKNDSLIKIMVSTTGAHQTKEMQCKGVQKGSDKSLVIVNEVLYYKSASCVCAFNGSIPISVSDQLSRVRYSKAVGGRIDDRYMVSMMDEKSVFHLFSYDTKKGIWVKEDNTSVLAFIASDDDLLFIDNATNKLMSVRGISGKKEADFTWHAVSGKIGYQMPDQKYIARVSVRISIERGAEADFFLCYDSSEVWEHQFNMAGSGTRTFTVPIIPHRCDHFQFKIKGKGNVKVLSISKTIEQGSDT